MLLVRGRAYPKSVDVVKGVKIPQILDRKE